MLDGLDVTLPPGLTGKPRRRPLLLRRPDRRPPKQSGGTAENASPSCPLASELGTVNVGAGSGAPFYVQGHAYLAGPYKGAPLSMAIITPAVAGPFDLGTVVVSAALYVNPKPPRSPSSPTRSRPSSHGIPLDVRSVAVNIARNQFTLNPTNCNPMALTGDRLRGLAPRPLSPVPSRSAAARRSASSRS